MPVINIEGVQVDFPREPYPCQVTYMKKVIHALATGKNALLESPTGTGKTLALLCSTLAWQQHLRGKSKAPPVIGYSGEPSAASSSSSSSSAAGNTSANSRPFTNVIVYATRTHSQLAQIVSELRSTNYKPRMTVLGSREQLCVHERISKLKGAMLNHACNSLNTKRGCMYRNNLDSQSDGGGIELTELMDIEELVKYGTHRKICPYFHSRDSSTSSEIVLLPYNYLLDSSIRNTLKLEWKQCIVIFDEAHNLERVAGDAASFSLSSTDIAACIEELQHALSTLRESDVVRKTEERPNGKTEDDASSGKPSNSSLSMTGGVQRPSLLNVMALLKSMFQLENRLDQLNLQAVPKETNKVSYAQGTEMKLPGMVQQGRWLSQLLSFCGFSNEHHVEELRKCANMLMEEVQDAMEGIPGASGAALSSEPKLTGFSQALDRILRSSRTGFIDSYRIYIFDEDLKSSSTSKRFAPGDSFRKQTKKRVINFWCFSTGVAMGELQQLGVSSLLLTSGTLSPMNALRDDLRLPFPIDLENPHVIGDKQIWVAVTTKGVSGKQLNSSYHNRDSDAYKDELGLSIVNICAKMTGHDRFLTKSNNNNVSFINHPSVRGGVLIFFPSYTVMEKTVSRWRESGVYDKLRTIVGGVVVETRSKSTLPNGGNPVDASVSAAKNKGGSSAWNSKAVDIKNDKLDMEGTGSIVSEFESIVQRNGGCVLMAVCRGKVSEGIDFTDHKGRVVIVTGIPYAPYMDPWVVLKKQYLDSRSGGCPKENIGTQQHSITPKTTTVAVNPYADYEKNMQSQQQSNAVKPQNSKNEILQDFPPSNSGNVWLNAKQLLQQSVSKNLSGALVKSSTTIGVGSAMSQRLHAPSHTSGNLMPSISGQQWYNQTASRAINQCIGRVIRHNRDWGAVFLLDDRFSYERQLSEISGWARKRVVKFTDFSTALDKFREFITAAAQDDSLVQKKLSFTDAGPRPNQYIFRNNDNNRINGGVGNDDFIPRQILLPSTAVGKAGDDETFIDPSLLLTQSESVMIPRLKQREADVEDEILQLMRRSSQQATSSSQQQESSVRSAVDKDDVRPNLFKTFKQNRGNGIAQPVARNQSHFSKPPMNASRSLSQTQRVENNNNNTSSQAFGLSSRSQSLPSQRSSNFGTSSSSAKTDQASKQSVQSFVNNCKALKSQTISQSSAAIGESSANGSKMNAFKIMLNQLRPLLSKENRSKLKIEVQNAHKSKFQLLSQVKQFYVGINDSLSELDKQDLQSSLHSDSSVLMLKWRAMLTVSSFISDISLRRSYEEMVEQASGIAAAELRRNDILPNAVDESAKRKTKRFIDDVDDVILARKNVNQHIESVLRDSRQQREDAFDFIDATQESSSSSSSRWTNDPIERFSHGSKRAKLALQSIKNENMRAKENQQLSKVNSTHTAVGTDAAVKKKWNHLENVELSGPVTISNRNSFALSSSTNNKLNKFCAVCRSKAERPCGNKGCGHICCETCWVQWLKKSSTCPHCRAHADRNTVTLLVVR